MPAALTLVHEGQASLSHVLGAMTAAHVVSGYVVARALDFILLIAIEENRRQGGRRRSKGED